MIILQPLTDLFFPRMCAGCDAPLRDSEPVICPRCLHRLPLTNHFAQKENEVYRRFYGRLPLEFAGALCYYHKKGIVQEMIRKLKYAGVEEVGALFGTFTAAEIAASAENLTVTDVVPVPLHPKKFRERGFNQVTSFASALARDLRIPCSPDVLRRNFYNKTQTKKNLLARTSLQKELFSPAPDTTPGRHFLLVDDVITTGSTLEACGRALLQIPDTRISIACMAMSH